MEWKEEYSVGIPEIDKQHKLLLGCFTDIEASIKSDQSWSNTHYAIIKLSQVAQMHFSFEEAIMRMFGYPGKEGHSKEHQRFINTLNNFETQSLKRSAEAKTKIEMVQFLQDWLTTHILVSDRGYVEHISSGAQIVYSSQMKVPVLPV